jgi:hypothetical protein
MKSKSFHLGSTSVRKNGKSFDTAARVDADRAARLFAERSS